MLFEKISSLHDKDFNCLHKFFIMSEKQLKEGSSAPLFSLPGQAGKKISIVDFRGKWVVLYFYPKDDTPGCTTEACDFTDSLKEFEKLDAVVLGVSVDSVESHQKFIEKYKLKINLLSDEQHKVIEKYGAWQLKNMYGKEFYGIVRSTFIIDPKGKIAHLWPKVNADGHVKEVMAKLQELKNN